VSVAACGGGGSGASASTQPPKTASGRPATVGVADTGLGKILVDSQGRTLYLFLKDSGTQSACKGACTSAWPPLRTSGKPTVGTGANAAIIAISPRSSNGTPQVIYNGQPGLTATRAIRSRATRTVQGLTAFGGGWFALTPAGDQVSGQPSNSGSGGGGGTHY